MPAWAVAGTAVLEATAGSTGDPRLVSVVEGSVAFEINQVGMVAVPADPASPSGWRMPGLLEAAQRAGAPYVLLVDLSTGEGTLSLTLNMTRAVDGKTLGDRREVFPIDIDLDSAVIAAVRSFFAENSFLNDPAPVNALAGGNGASPPKSAPTGLPGSPGAGAALGPAVGSSGTVAAPPVPVAERRYTTGSFAIGVAPLLLVGETSSFFRYGVTATFSGLWTISSDRLLAAAGLEVGTIRIFPNAGLPNGDVYSFSAGPTLQIQTSFDAPVVLAVRATAGAAVLAVRLPGQPVRATTRPYVGGDLLARVHLSDRLFVGAGVGYLSVFDAGAPVMGVTPSVMFGIRPRGALPSNQRKESL